MPLKKRVQTAFLFPNGVLAACDARGEQIPELQGAYSIDKHKRICLEALPDCKFNGFHILPDGFFSAVDSWLEYFADKNMSWEEINDI